MSTKLTRFLLTLLLVTCALYSLGGLWALADDSISSRELLIDLEEGVTTEAQLTFPSIGDGPFPGVLLIPGSGASDMNEYIPEGTATGEPVRPFLQIAEYLSERGFAVLRYNKRGVDLNYSSIDMGVALNWTYPILKNDAEKVLHALMKQSEVDPEDITIIGHSEGSFIASLVAAANPEVEKLVLMGVARHPRELAYWQLVELKILYAQDVLDQDGDGNITIPDVAATIGSDNLLTIQANQLIENSTGEWRWRPIIDQNSDGFFSIIGELKPLLLQSHSYMTTAEYPGSKLFQSSDSVDSMVNTLPEVSSSILILHGEDDIIAPLQEAYILEQTLMQKGHVDHTLISYPGLSHYFYTSDGYSMAIGPLQNYVLSDIVSWLTDPARNIRFMEQRMIANERILGELRGQLDVEQKKNEALERQILGIRSNYSTLEKTINEITVADEDVERVLDWSQNLSYLSLGLSLVIMAIMIARVKR